MQNILNLDEWINENIFDIFKKNKEIKGFIPFIESEKRIITIYLTTGQEPEETDGSRIINYRTNDDEGKDIYVVLSKITLDGNNYFYNASVTKGTKTYNFKSSIPLKHNAESFNAMLLKNFISKIQNYY